MTAYRWREEDAEFAAEWERAKAIGLDALEDEALRRAFEGVEVPVLHKGQTVATVRNYSDTLAIFLLKGGKPEKYRERTSTELTGAGGAGAIHSAEGTLGVEIEVDLEKAVPKAGVGEQFHAEVVL